MSLRKLIVTSGTLVALAFVASQAQAEIVLRAETSEFCEVEVSVGADAPNAPVQKFGDLTLPWEHIFDADKICFRHSVEDDCDAFVDWQCCESSGGKETLCVID